MSKSSLYNKALPLVSVILPTYNRAGVIEKAVASVTEQSYPSWELIIIDDGSGDDTFDVVKKYIDELQNIKYFKREHAGLPESLNAGIERSKGEFITFIGSDDEYKPEHIELRMKLFAGDNELQFIHGGVKIIGNPFVKDKRNMNKLIHINECAVGGTFFVKRNVFEKIGRFHNVPYSEDSEFYERAVREKIKILEIDFPTYIYFRESEDGICNNL